MKLISNGNRRWRAPNKGKGGTVGDRLGDRLRPRGRRRRGRQQGRARRRRQPDRDGLGNRALRLRHLRRDQDRARPGRRHLRDDHLAGDADEDDRPHPDPGLGRPGLRRRLAARRKTSPDGANRSATSSTPQPRGDRPQRPPALPLLPALVQQGLRSTRPGRPLPGRDQRHQGHGPEAIAERNRLRTRAHDDPGPEPTPLLSRSFSIARTSLRPTDAAAFTSIATISRRGSPARDPPRPRAAGSGRRSCRWRPSRRA